MPGTILVSVLEIMDFPLSSSRTVKVSLGKSEYQTREKEDISFPLISLRDNLIVRVEDAGGVEIAFAGIEARSIVERGIWDDFFSLGDGTVHLKLQFVLSEEERDRIRRMREIALKKKHRQLLTSALISQESNTNGGNVASPSSIYHDISESQRNHHQLGADPVKDVVYPVTSGSSNHENTEHIFTAQPDPEQQKSNDADKKKPSTGVPATEASELSEQIHGRFKKIQNWSTAADFGRSSPAGETSSLSKSLEKESTTSSHLVSPNTDVKSSPSSVRQMINAFETTQSQDLRSKVKQLPFNQSSITPSLTPFNLQRSLEIKKLDCDSTNNGVHRSNPFTPKSSRINWHLKGLNKTDVHNNRVQSIKKSFVKASTESKRAAKRKSKDFLQTFAVEAATSPGYKPRIASDRTHSNSTEDEKISGANSTVEDRRMRHTSKDSHSCPQFSPPERVARFKDRYSSSENLGIWIFPDARRLCITTGGKNVMALAEGQPKIVDKNATDNGTETKVSQSKELRKVKQSKSKASEDEVPGGPFQQAIKVAIIAGFGILVVLTRQRENR